MIAGSAHAVDRYPTGPQYATSSVSARDGTLNWLKSGSINFDQSSFKTLSKNFYSVIMDKNNVPSGVAILTMNGVTVDNKNVMAMFILNPSKIYKDNSGRIYIGGKATMFIYVYEKGKMPIVQRGYLDSLRFDVQNGNLVNVAAGNGSGTPDNVLRITGMNVYKFSFKEYGYSPFLFFI